MWTHTEGWVAIQNVNYYGDYTDISVFSGPPIIGNNFVGVVATFDELP